METTQPNLLWAVRDMRDGKSWIQFYDIYSSMLRRFFSRMGLTEADAEDALQDVLMVAHRSLAEDKYDPSRGRFRSWIYGIARRRALVALRDRKRPTRVQFVSIAEGADPMDALEDPLPANGHRDLWDQEWKYALLDEGLRYAEQRVGNKAFRAFQQYVHERRPVEEVAAELGLSASSVYVYKNRVLGAVRDWVGQFETPG